MEFYNWIDANREAYTVEQRDEALRNLTLLLAPIAPFHAEELWERLGQPYSVHEQAWPEFDPAMTREELVEVVVQVNGKVRDRLSFAPDLAEAEARGLALGSTRVQEYLAGREPAKVIYVPGRLVNIVVR